MMDILDMESLQEEFMDTKDLIDKELVSQNEPIPTKSMGIFGVVEINSYKSKNLLMLIS